jgi:tetratricopeptide (TPR) repeat protein
VYVDRDVIEFITQHFLPVRAHVREQAQEFQRLGERFGAQWTPAILIVAPDGTERHRIEGFLPKDDFLAQLMVGLAKSDFARGRFAEARRWYAQVLEKYPDTESAPEAQYWAGVAEYKESGDAAALGATAKRFTERYSDSTWAKKASVWG